VKSEFKDETWRKAEAREYPERTLTSSLWETIQVFFKKGKVKKG
jgi:hypothetical protein